MKGGEFFVSLSGFLCQLRLTRRVRKRFSPGWLTPSISSAFFPRLPSPVYFFLVPSTSGLTCLRSGPVSPNAIQLYIPATPFLWLRSVLPSAFALPCRSNSAINTDRFRFVAPGPDMRSRKGGALQSSGLSLSSSP